MKYTSYEVSFILSFYLVSVNRVYPFLIKKPTVYAGLSNFLFILIAVPLTFFHIHISVFLEFHALGHKQNPLLRPARNKPSGRVNDPVAWIFSIKF